jgi:hypothetical protein
MPSVIISDSRRGIVPPLPSYPRLVSVIPSLSEQKSVNSVETMGSHIATSHAQYGGWDYVQGGMHTNTGKALSRNQYEDRDLRVLLDSNQTSGQAQHRSLRDVLSKALESMTA